MSEQQAMERIDRALHVGVLPRRVAHVTHALQIAVDERNGGPVRPSEIMIYDGESLTLGSTCSALRRAMEHGLVDRGGRGLYFAREKAEELRDQLETRYLRDTKGETGA